MEFDEIKKELEFLGIAHAQICDDLGFDRGDWGNYYNGKKPLPESRRKALLWYVKYQKLIKTIEDVKK